MLGAARALVGSLARTIAQVEAADPRGEEAAGWLGLAGEIERLGAGLRLLVADRAAQAASWGELGHRSPAAWVAAVAGTSPAEGRATLEASERLAGLAATRQAASCGALTPRQLQVVAAAASVDPSREEELLEVAEQHDDAGLRRLAHAVVDAAVSISPATPPDPAKSRRYLRWWSEDDGLLRLAGAFEAEAGAMLVDAVRARAAFVADEAAATGAQPEEQSAYDADALVALVIGDTRRATFAGNVGGCPPAPPAGPSLPVGARPHVAVEPCQGGCGMPGGAVAVDLRTGFWPVRWDGYTVAGRPGRRQWRAPP